VRRRIVTLSVLAAVLAISLFGIPLAIAVSQYYLGDERNGTEQAADIAAISVTTALARGDRPDHLRVAESDITVGLYTTAGSLLTGQGPAFAEPVVLGATGGRVTGGDHVGGLLVVAVPVTDGDRVTGIVRAASDYSSVRLRIGGTWAVMVGLGMAAVSATYLVAQWQARRLAAPMEALSATAAQLGQGDFSVRTGTSGVPEIDSAGASLNTTAGRLGAMVARERAVSADASHQLRTPLTGLRLGLETALDSGDPDVLRSAMVGAIDAVDRLERTIEDLLALARGTGHDGAVLPIRGLVDESVVSWRPALQAAGRDLRLEIDDELPDILASEAAVRQVVGVLLDNAVTHGRGTVTLTVRDAGGAVALDVTDEGPGVPDGEQLFTRRAESTSGHGIGLSLARTLAEAEGGRLRLSRPKPPVFSLLLPAAGRHAAGKPATG
jgi:signal transduction histidine kinase